jgi:hypothetical protein
LEGGGEMPVLVVLIVVLLLVGRAKEVDDLPISLDFRMRLKLMIMGRPEAYPSI